MASTIIPVQTRYNDPFQQMIFQYNTADSKMYISRESNKLLKVIGDDVILKGMDMFNVLINPPSTIQASIDIGMAIQDCTLIQFTGVGTVDIDAAALVDTPTGGAHLAIFLRYNYLETIEANLATIDIFHVQADGTVTDPLGRFDANSCRVLLGIIDFTKVGSDVTDSSINNSPTMVINGMLKYVRGAGPDNVMLSGLLSIMFSEEREFLLKRDYLFME